jgi:hypothetical protein
MNENTQVATVQDAGTTAFAMMNDGAMMDRMIRFAEIMASGKSTIPNELRNPGDCLAITMQAMAWRMMPQAVAQKCFFLNGRIGYEAQLVAAAINNSGATVGNFQFEWFGPWEKVVGKFEIKTSNKDGKFTEYRVPGWKLADEEGIGIRVWATLRGESQPRVLELLLAQARTRNSTQWADDPKQQLAYLAQKKWARLYAPGVILGVYTPDELADPEERVINPIPERGESVPTASLPPYPADQFQNNLPAWRESIAAGKATAEKIIARSSTKYTWSDEQKSALCAPPAAEKQPEVIDAEFTAAYDAASQEE